LPLGNIEFLSNGAAFNNLAQGIAEFISEISTAKSDVDTLKS